MGDGIGDVAKSWLADPPWQKVFKHTFDVIEVSIYPFSMQTLCKA
jgi:hypothetical protein